VGSRCCVDIKGGWKDVGDYREGCAAVREEATAVEAPIEFGRACVRGYWRGRRGIVEMKAWSGDGVA